MDATGATVGTAAIDGGVWIVTIQRPEVRNAVDGPTAASLAAAFREFEEETGVLLPELKLFRLFRREPGQDAPLADTYHAFFGDPDIDERDIAVNEGQAFRYWAPQQLAELAMPAHARAILEEFFASAHYRRLFH